MADTKISEAVNLDSIRFQEQASDPATPAAGYGAIYTKTDGFFYHINDAGTITDLTGGDPFAILQDQKATTTAGGASSSTTWNNRDLNTEVSDVDGIVQIAVSTANTFTPIAGDFRLLATAAAGAAAAGGTVFHRLRLYNVTQASVVDEGLNAVTVEAQRSHAQLAVAFTADGSDEYRIDHYTNVGQATSGLGVAVGDGSNETYLTIVLIKVG